MNEDWRANKRLIPYLESVQKHIEDAGRYVGANFTSKTQRFLAGFPVESPIEAVFYAWWMALEEVGNISPGVIDICRQDSIECQGRKYRVDFVLRPPEDWIARAKTVDLPVAFVAVELDGHDYHERTREQVIERNERDRNLQADGWTVLHFSGSEVHNDPMKCVAAAFQAAFDKFGFLWQVEIEAREGALAYDDYHNNIEKYEGKAAERAADTQAGAPTSQES